MSSGRRTVLFLCTGNYYRSRFAEHLFNALARAAGLPWQARSRGLAVEWGTGNVGPISPYTREALSARGILLSDDERFPQPAVEADFAAAECVIALDETEHRPLLEQRFPAWAGRTEYWNVPDVLWASPQRALAEIEKQVRELLGRLNPGAIDRL